MKTNLTTLLFYFHKILYGFIYFSIKYLKTDSLFQAIFLISYILSSTLFIYSIFNELNIICINVEAMNYYNELDCPTELIDQCNNKIQDTNLFNNHNNILSKFLNLFNRANVITDYVLPEQLKNTYYIENSTAVYDLNGNLLMNFSNESSLSGMYSYHYRSAAFMQKMFFYVDILRDTLTDLKSINDSLMRKL
jgi:hypothetical protein